MMAIWLWLKCVNTLRPRENGRHFADDIFKCIFLNENVWIPIRNSVKFVPKGPINNIPALVQIMAWRRPGDKPLSEPMVVSLTTHICVNVSADALTIPSVDILMAAPTALFKYLISIIHLLQVLFRCIFLKWWTAAGEIGKQSYS